jgi:3-oxoacyl-[acyl-carrier-protein] synthase-1
MGFFSKKAAPVAPRTKAAPPPAPIAITGVGLACHAGDKPLSLICSILGQISGTELSDTFKVKSENGGGYANVRTAPVAEFAHQQTQQRMNTLTAIALTKAAAQLPANVPTESILIIIMVDPQLINPSNETDQQRLQSYLIDGMPRIETATFRIQPNNVNSGTSALRTAVTELNEGKWQAIIFGGSDSLLSMETCLALNEQNRLNTTSTGTGLVPGEGAAFVVLQTKDAAASNTTPALAYLSGLGVAAEPNARDADLKATEGLSTAINQAITQAGIAATDIQGIVHNLGAETVHAIEWYQTTKKIWPRRVSEQQRVAAQLGEIEQADMPDDPIPQTVLPYKTMGEVGAAALPMQMATALAWIEYDAHQARWGFPVRQHLLVCDTPAAAERGALVISKTLAAAS